MRTLTLPGRLLGAAILVASFASARPVAARDIRVAILVDAPEVAMGRRGRELVLTAGPEGRQTAMAGTLRFAVRPAAAAPVAAPRWVVFVRTERDRRKAELVEQGLRSALKVALRVEKGSGGWTVVAGPFDTERKAEGIRDQLHVAGMTEASVADLPSERQGDETPARLVVIDGGFKVTEIAAASARVVAADREPIEMDGRTFRGALDVAVNARGLLTVVESLGLEDYVRGVVPQEMGPEVYPIAAALEAQAIAARTYVLRARQHPDEGFDACATAHCQVYGGASAEHPLSDVAIARTAGQILTFDGRPALTYFSSTCGGHTEGVSDVFEGQSEPYLVGVPCYPEQVAFRRITGRRIAPDWHLVSGVAADETLARLVVAGVVGNDVAQAAGFGRRATLPETVEWVRRTAIAGGTRIRERTDASLSVDTVLSFLRSLVGALGLSDQRRLIVSQDLAAAQRFRVLDGLSGEALADALIALKAGIVPLGFEAGWATSRISRGNVLEILALWLAVRGRFDVPPARFLSGGEGGLRVLAGKDISTIPLAGSPILLAGRRGAAPRLRDGLDLKVGDKLWMQRDASGAVQLVFLEDDPDGAAFDRTSAYSWWTRRIPVDQLARSAEAKASLAGLKDLRVTRVSPGGRIVGLDLVGASQTVSVSGFAVRDVLSVPDLRATLQVERDDAGRLTAVLLTGRGWGHGVGLCQTGAHGMALAGAPAQDILAHYYPGTTLQQLP